MNDGSAGVVLANHPGRYDVQLPARPVVALLTDGQGEPLAHPHPLDLAQAEGRAIVRTLTPEERQRMFGGVYPEWV
jgi:hypothetical protein